MPAAIILVSPPGATAAEALIAGAVRASLRDLIDLLRRHTFAPIVVAARETDALALPAAPDLILRDDPPDRPFHFGERLIALIEVVRPSWSSADLASVLVVGAGSVPLWDDSIASRLIAFATPDESDRAAPVVLTNNLHSSDWLLLRTEAAIATASPVIRAAARDNSLAWLLSETLGDGQVVTLTGADPVYGFDLDTPTDLAILAAYPPTPTHLHGWLNRSAGAWASIRLAEAIAAMRRPGNTIALIGRVSPGAWSAINGAAHCWTRVIAEERGMVAAGRVEAGQVRSVLMPWLMARGVDGFFADLAELCDAALFDSRVLFTARGMMLSPGDRFASDLLLPDVIADSWLRDFTEAAAHCPIPVILGGHSVVAGGVYALAKVI